MFNWLFLLAMAIIGWIAQFVDGTLGMGYGTFSASLLISLGLYPVIASASVHAAQLFTTLISGASHLRLGNVKGALVLVLTFAGLPGGVLGAYSLASMGSTIVKPVVATILLGMGLAVLYRFLRVNPSEPAHSNPGVAVSMAKVERGMGKLAALGFAAAFMDAVGGGGWGPIATPSLILTGDHEARKVVGSVNLAEFFITLAEVFTFIVTLGPGSFRWDITFALLIGGATAAPVAAFLCSKVPEKLLGLVIGGTLVALNLRTLLSLF